MFFERITDNIFIGDYDSACNIDLLCKKNINNVLNLTDNLLGERIDCNINYHNVHIHDSIHENIINYLPQCLSLIDLCINNDQKILVNCYKCYSRSPAIILAYLLLKTDLTFSQVYKQLKVRIPKININKSFVTQIKTLYMITTIKS